MAAGDEESTNGEKDRVGTEPSCKLKEGGRRIVGFLSVRCGSKIRSPSSRKGLLAQVTVEEWIRYRIRGSNNSVRDIHAAYSSRRDSRQDPVVLRRRQLFLFETSGRSVAKCGILRMVVESWLRASRVAMLHCHIRLLPFPAPAAFDIGKPIWPPRPTTTSPPPTTTTNWIVYPLLSPLSGQNSGSHTRIFASTRRPGMLRRFSVFAGSKQRDKLLDMGVTVMQNGNTVEVDFRGNFDPLCLYRAKLVADVVGERRVLNLNLGLFTQCHSPLFGTRKFSVVPIRGVIPAAVAPFAKVRRRQCRPSSTAGASLILVCCPSLYAG
ncbi:hypothetical protein DFH06DRAFT_1305939 [Mycena polygramma]|nr:hypothetical protein DFH06DRAFT_1305939 [Mycena polygramma]